MKTSTITLSVLLAGAVAYAGFLQTEVNRLKAARSVESPAGLAEVKASGVSEPAEERAVVSAPPPAAVAAPDVESSPPASPPAGDWQTRRAERMKQMVAAFEDPQMRVDMIERQMNRVDSRYADFFKTLDLSPEDLDTLRTLMAEQGVVNWEMRMRSFEADSDEARSEMDAAREIQKKALENQIDSLLGEAGAAALEDYSETLPYRNEVEGLATSLSFTSTPLTAGQSEALVGTIRDVSKSFEYTVDLSQMRGREMSKVDAADIDSYFQERSTRDEMILQAAAESLNDEQLAAFAERQMAERERDRRQLEFMQQNPGGFGRGGTRNGPRP